MEKIKFPQSFLVIFFTISVRAIQLCCPEGEIYSKIGVEQPNRCEESHDKYGCVKTAKALPKYWVSEHKDKSFKLSGTNNKFSCQENQELINTFHIFPENATMDVSAAKELVITIDDEIHIYGSFCLYFTELYEGEDINKGYFSPCDFEDSEDLEADKGEKMFTGIFYPAAFSISAIFFLITLIHFIAVEDIKKLSSVLTIGFLINALISYFILSITFSLSVYDKYSLFGSNWCKVFGYIIHHTFLAFFFWTSAMAFNIARTLTKVQMIRSKKPSIKTILGHTLYAQGLPTLITVLTVILDEAVRFDITRPNMGTFNCFVRTQYGTVDSFFQSAQFLHFHLMMGILIMVNIICFLITGINLCSHWRNMTHINSSDGITITKQFRIVLKIFIIMGIPWICDFFSKWLEFNPGRFDNSLAIRLSLDMVHLTAGVWIFIVLVGLRPVMRGLQESSMGSFMLKSYGMWGGL